MANTTKNKVNIKQLHIVTKYVVTKLLLQCSSSNDGCRYERRRSDGRPLRVAPWRGAPVTSDARYEWRRNEGCCFGMDCNEGCYRVDLVMRLTITVVPLAS